MGKSRVKLKDTPMPASKSKSAKHGQSASESNTPKSNPRQQEAVQLPASKTIILKRAAICQMLLLALLFITGRPAWSAPPFKPWGSDCIALVIGISQYGDSRIQAKYAAKDAKDFYDYLIKDQAVPPGNVNLLLNEQATRQNILQSLGEWLPRRALPKSKVIIYFSGLTKSFETGDSIAAAYDTRLEQLLATGVSLGLVAERIRNRGGVEPNQSVMIVDGSIDAVKLNKLSGLPVITAGDTRQATWESVRYANGVFTRRLLESLRKSHGDIYSLDFANDLKKSVAQEVLSDRGMSQIPQLAGFDESPNSQPPVAVSRQGSGSMASSRVGVPTSQAATSVQPVSAGVVNTPIADKWALVIGISKFKDPSNNLKYASKDAEDFRNFLVNEAGFRADHVKMLLDQQATHEAITDAFTSTWLERVVDKDDLVVIYISTHGTPDKADAGGVSYIAAWDTDTNRLVSTGVKMSDLCSWLKTYAKVDRGLVIMDACYSGATESGGKGMFRSMSASGEELAQGSGLRVICASDAQERSWESKNHENSVFTYYLLEALRKNAGKVRIDEAFDEIKDKVSWEVRQAYRQKQTPQKKGQWQGKDLVLSAPATKPRPVLIP